jgi:hypothetical protein
MPAYTAMAGRFRAISLNDVLESTVWKSKDDTERKIR